jgi:hypothetical protein
MIRSEELVEAIKREALEQANKEILRLKQRVNELLIRHREVHAFELYRMEIVKQTWEQSQKLAEFQLMKEKYLNQLQFVTQYESI